MILPVINNPLEERCPSLSQTSCALLFMVDSVKSSNPHPGLWQRIPSAKLVDELKKDRGFDRAT